MSIETKYQRLLKAVEEIDPNDRMSIVRAKAVAKGQEAPVFLKDGKRLKSNVISCVEDEYGGMYWASVCLPNIVLGGKAPDETDKRYMGYLLDFIRKKFLF